MTLTVGMATIDCEDPQRLAEFYAQVLDMQVLADYGEFVVLGRDGAPINIGLQRVPEPRNGKNRLHLDLRGEPRSAAVDRVVGIGAIVKTEHSVPGLAWTVLTDPEGNEFCIGEPAD